MSSDYLRLAEPPALDHPGNPVCGACHVETRCTDGSWLCPSCGTTWPNDSMEQSSEAATMYEDWAGESLPGPTCPNDDAWRFALVPPEDRAEGIRALVARKGQS